MDTNWPTFISYYTKSHAELANRLIQSLDKFKLPHDIVEIDDFDKVNNGLDTEKDIKEKTWSKTCQKRCDFIHDKLNTYQKVVWMDSDTIVVKEPKLFSELTDMYMIGISMRPSGMIGGVIWADKSSQWFWKMVSETEGYDEDVRTNNSIYACRNAEIPLHIYPLPIAYQYVPWLFRLECPLPEKEVVIVHTMSHSKIANDEAWAKWHRGI